ncbi:MAG: NADH-dependent [FeFe] hydrogenase, group A6 [Clostridia bacterium]
MIKLNIDGLDVEVKENSTILDACKKLNIDVPTLCFLKEINEVAACRMCLVEVEGRRDYIPSCVEPAQNGMIVRTSTPKLLKYKKNILELILSNHNKSCLTCSRNTNCELQALCKKFNIHDIKFEGVKTETIKDTDSSCIVRDTSKCILCKKCVSVCKNIQGVCAIESINRGFNTKIGTYKNMSIADSTCVGCGQCIVNCPTGALKEKDYTKEVYKALNDKNITVVIQTAPAVRATIGEEFGLEPGTLVTGKMVAGLRLLGFDVVFDTDLAADITIAEEGNEFIERLNENKLLPMITSCSSGWITYAEKFYPNSLKYLSTTKSPMEIMGVLIKKYYAKKQKIDNIYSVALMPCSAKKAEIIRKELLIDGKQMVDNVITTREVARMFKENNIDISKLSDSNFDDPLGNASGAGHIFGVSGGVMEAALRSVEKMLTNKDIDNIEFHELRGFKGIKEATITIKNKKINIAVVQGLKNASKIMDDIKNNTCKYHFVEIMTCPGGCIMGGGQPINIKYTKEELFTKRSSALYKADTNSDVRISINNDNLKKVYTDYIDKIDSHKLLHTVYNKQDVYFKK